MKSCVLVKISKKTLAFWYLMEGGDFAPLSIKGGNIVPLCFYVNGNDFKIGQFARERVLVNDPHSYDNYFELVKDPTKYFLLHGDSKPIKQLLYYGIENYLSHFIKTILYKNESIEAFRSNFCLRFLFDVDIEKPEKLLVENLFKEAGYENIEEINFDRCLNHLISDKVKAKRTRLFLIAVSNDLFVKLFTAPQFQLATKEILEELGSDPRAKIIAKLILEDIKEAKPHIHIEEEKDIGYIIYHCNQLLGSLKPIMRGEIELSSGEKVDYKIRFRHLQERLIYNRGVEDKVLPKLEKILKANGCDPSTTDVILYGDELNTDYFKEKLKRNFPYVFGLPGNIESEILKTIFSEVASGGFKANKSNALGCKPPILTPPKRSENSSVIKPESKIITPTGVNPLPKAVTPPGAKVPPVTKPDFVGPPVTKQDKPKKVQPPPLLQPKASVKKK